MEERWTKWLLSLAKDRPGEMSLRLTKQQTASETQLSKETGTANKTWSLMISNNLDPSWYPMIFSDSKAYALQVCQHPYALWHRVWKKQWNQMHYS